jgi:hypothetical protein
MKNLDYYLNYDHNARAKTTHLSVISAAVIGAVVVQFDVSPKYVGIACIITAGIVEIARAWTYVQPHTRKVADSQPSRIRRSLILAPAFFLVFLACWLLPVSGIEAAAVERKLKDTADDPLDPENLKETKRTLIRAEVSKVKIHPTVVQDAGNKFLNAAVNNPDNPDAWNATLAYVNYKSFLNTSLSVKVSSAFPSGIKFTTTYHFLTPPGTSSPEFSVVGDVPAGGAESAQFGDIGKPDLNASNLIANDWIIAAGGALILDGMRFKKVIFRNVEIYYNGGPLEMNEVYCLGCTFNITQTPNGKRFVERFLDPSPSIKFNA